jgi:hypothetical protein
MKEKILTKLRELTGHEHVYLAPRGNKAIEAALRVVKGCKGSVTLAIPDQGGWLTYGHYAKKFNIGLKRLSTDYGIINPDSIEHADALMYANPAGYYAEQPVGSIYAGAKKNKCLVILDASGCIGAPWYQGNGADIIIGSFGRWKPVNLGYGGFISIRSAEFAKKNHPPLSDLGFKEEYLAKLYKKLEVLPERYAMFLERRKKIMHDCADYGIMHRDKHGINVIIQYADETEKSEILAYCEKNKYPHTFCPRAIRVNENAISIEVKRGE